jgi:hypothetical protein
MLDPSLELIDIDFETRWGTDYTLKSMSTTEYVRDERFEVHGFGIARQSEGFKPRFIRAPQAYDYLESLPWERICLSAHHMNFDGLVLAHAFHMFPARYFCTQSASRFWHKCETRHSLEDLAGFHGIAGKLDGLKVTKDKTYSQLSPTDLDTLETYTIRDLKIGLYLTLFLARHIPPDEQLLMDATIRMFTQPVCEVDLPLAREALAEVKAEKQSALGTFDQEMLRSRTKFAAYLESLGVEPPMKRSTTTGKPTYAFAKKDEDFLELLTHPNEQVRDAVEAKLEASSNIDVTRAERLIKMGETGPLAVCLNFAGAHTDRWSGGNKMNIQNFRSGSKLRRAIRAQRDHVLVVVDASQIEARYNAWFNDQDDLLDLFRRKEDPYDDLASYIYKRPIQRKVHQADKIPGFVGKTAFLGLGYQMGAPKFQATLATSKERVNLPLVECYQVVTGYRQKNYAIAAGWERCQEWIDFLANGRGTRTYKCITLDADAKRIWFPNASSLYYPGLHWDGREATYVTASGVRYIYGGKLMENIIQKLARNNIGEVMLQVLKRYRIAWMTHDEIVAHVPKEQAEQALAWIIELMRISPLWAPGIPLNAEGGFDECYSK